MTAQLLPDLRYTLRCDGCGAELAPTRYVGLARIHAQRAGWRFRRERQGRDERAVDTCPECAR